MLAIATWFFLDNFYGKNKNDAFEQHLSDKIASIVVDRAQCKNKRGVEVMMRQLTKGFRLFDSINYMAVQKVGTIKERICFNMADIFTTKIMPLNYKNWDCAYKNIKKLDQEIYDACNDELKSVVVVFQ